MFLKKLLLISLLVSVHLSFSQNFSIFKLDENLTKNANAVVNYDDYSIELVKQDKMLIRHKMSISVLNKNADHYGSLTLFYDKSNQVKKVNMEFFDVIGNSIKKVKKSDFDDYSATEGFSLYSDNRAIHYDYTATTYPYTVTFEYELEKKNTAFIPSWFAVSSYNVGVKSSSFSFSYPEAFTIQNLESNFDGYGVGKIESTGFLQYKLADLPAIEYETYGPGLKKLVPMVKLASSKFHLSGVNGTADNWSDFGKWMYNELLASRNNLSQETVVRVKEMVNDVVDPLERAKIIYEYVQNKTRYISVQVELGGWQPMLSGDVDRLGYGDCKALTFYTKSLMDVAEVPSFYSAVFSDLDKRDIEKEIVSVQGNHVFLCLPQEKDSIWLECTSQKLPFGFVNASTEDRDVLVISPEGGKIVHTNSNKPEENLQEITATFLLEENGSIQGSANINSYGVQYLQHLSKFEGLSPDDLDKSMKEHFALINNLRFSKIKVLNNKEEKRFEENIVFEAKNYGIMNSDSSIILNLNALNRVSHVPDREKNRKTPFEILRGFKDVDSYTIKLPESYTLSELPEEVTIENQFGIYHMSVEKVTDNSLVYKRELLINKGFYTKDLYEAYRKFRKKIKKLENIKIVIIKK